MPGNNRTGRTRKMQEPSFDGIVDSVETPTVDVWLLTSDFSVEDICLFECNLGAIETSVFVEKRSAFFFDGGSRPAAKRYEQCTIKL